MIAYFKRLLTTIDSALCSIDETKFRALVDDCVRVLQNDHKIVISGLGKNVPICEKFTGTMVSMGLNSQFLHTNSAVHGDMGIVKNGDMIIILTKSGETQESIYLSRKLRDRDAKQWLLTFKQESTLAKEIGNVLCITMDHEGDMWNIMPNNSTTLNLIVLQAIAMHTAQIMNVQIGDFKRNHPGGHIGELLQ